MCLPFLFARAKTLFLAGGSSYVVFLRKLHKETEIIMSIFDSADDKTKEKLKEIMQTSKPAEAETPKSEKKYYTNNRNPHHRGFDLHRLTTPDFVAVDIETTGLHKINDRITEIGAVKFIDGKIAEEFSMLVNPGIDIPARITQITGIDNETVKDAPSFSEVMPKFLEFAGRLAICGHNVDFDISFLNAEIKRSRGQEITNWNIDTLILARTILELEEGYALGKVARHLNIALENAHRALDDARASGLIALTLIPKITKMPILTRARIANNSVGFTKRLFERTLNNYQIPQKWKYETVPNIKPLSPNQNRHEMSEKMLEKRYNQLPQIIKNYKFREEQFEYTKIVADAFNNNKIAALEAGTGTGKTVAYLIPAVLTTLGLNKRIVISTNTKHLQNQLVEQDLPRLAKLYTQKLSFAVLKGKNNYICRKAFESVINGVTTGISPKDKNTLLPLINWYEKTKSGDIEEQNAFNRRAAKLLWNKISAENKQCAGCEFINHCFLTKARRYAMAANIVVVNHAFFYSDIIAGNEIIENTAALIFDEAHRIEETGYYSLQVDIDTNRISVATDIFQHIHTVLYNLQKDLTPRHDADLFSVSESANEPNENQNLPENNSENQDAAAQPHQNAVPQAPQVEQEFIDDVLRLKHILHNLRKAGENFLAQLSDWLVKNNPERNGTQNAIITIGYKNAPFANFDGLKSLLFNIGEFLDVTRLIRQKHTDLISQRNILAEIVSAQNTAQQLSADLKYVCNAEIEGDIFWAEGPTNKKWIKLTGTTTDIKGFLEPFWKQYNRPVIFTSATLSPQKNIEYFAERVGISGLSPILKEFETKIENGSEKIFFAAAQTCPETGTDEHNDFTAKTLKELQEKYQKNILALFTNNESLEAVFNKLTNGDRHAKVFAQGISGNNAWISKQMKDNQGVILLGCGSFWEGVDMPGNECEIVVIPKLPFPVPTHPLQKQLAQNAENEGKNGFMDYSLPETLLKFRQGIGRLIRRDEDSGALFVLDSRIITKPYGKKFRNLIGYEVNKYSSLDEIYEKLDNFFEKENLENEKK